MRGWQQYFSYANVVATLALAVALSGSAVAANYVITSSAQIRNGVVTGKDVKDKSLTPQDVRGSLQGPKGDTGPAGPKGEAGPAGPKGDTGPAGPISGVAAGGDLTGTYPDPQLKSGSVGTGELAVGARGVALAGAVVRFNGTVDTYFNRRGGAPTVTRTATGQYDIVFPGFTAWYVETAPVATLFSLTPGEVTVTTSGGHFLVNTYTSAGALADHYFVLLCYPMSTGG